MHQLVVDVDDPTSPEARRLIARPDEYLYAEIRRLFVLPEFRRLEAGKLSTLEAAVAAAANNRITRRHFLKAAGAALLITALSTTAAGALVGCNNNSPPTPTTPPKPAIPFSPEGGESPIAYLSIDPRTGKPIRLNVQALAPETFPAFKSAQEGLACDKIIRLEDLTVVFGSKNGGISIAYLFKNQPTAPSSLSFVGSAPNQGQHTQAAKTGNYLIIASKIEYYFGKKEEIVTAQENNAMLDAIARNIPSFTDPGGVIHNWGSFNQASERNALSYASKIAIYDLTKASPVPYESDAKPPYVVLDKAASRPVAMLPDVEVESMEIVNQNGKPMLKLALTAKQGQRSTTQRYAVPNTPLIDIEQIVKTGILTDTPLIK